MALHDILFEEMRRSAKALGYDMHMYRRLDPSQHSFRKLFEIMTGVFNMRKTDLVNARERRFLVGIG